MGLGRAGGEIVEGLGKALWKSGVPEEIMDNLIKTNPKDAGNYLKAITGDKTGNVADQIRQMYVNLGSPDYDTRDLGFQALNATGGITNDMARNSAQADNIQHITKKQQRLNDAAAKKQLKEQESLDRLNPDKPGMATRQDKGFLQSPGQASYQQHLLGPLKKNVDEAGAVQFAKAEAHHAGPLDKRSLVSTNHPSFQEMSPGQTHWMIDPYKELNIELGNSEKNIASILETITKQSRRARIQGLSQQVDGLINETTLNALLGGYGPTSSKVDFGEISKQNLDLGKGKNPKVNPKSYPEYPVLDADDKLLEKWQPKTTDDFKFRFDRIKDIYAKHGIELPRTPKVKDAKIDRNLDIYGIDHENVHVNIDNAEFKKGTGLFNAKNAVETGSIKGMSRAEAFILDFYQLKDMENILANQLLYRYKLIKKLYNTGGRKNFRPSRIPWDQLPEGAKLNYYVLNLNRIAVLGGNNKGPSLEQSLKPVTEWDDGLVEIFGWTPQTMNITDETVNEVAQRIFEPNPIWKMTEADKAAHMESVVKNLHETNYQTSGMGTHTQVESLGK